MQCFLTGVVQEPVVWRKAFMAKELLHVEFHASHASSPQLMGTPLMIVGKKGPVHTRWLNDS